MFGFVALLLIVRMTGHDQDLCDRLADEPMGSEHFMCWGNIFLVAVHGQAWLGPMRQA